MKQTDDDLEAYKEFVNLPLDKRRLAFETLTPQRKSFFWQEHLKNRLRKDSNLNQDQRNLILEAISLVSPELFSVTEDSVEWETSVEPSLKSLEVRAKKIFSAKQGTETFATIGEYAAFDGGTPICTCNTIFDWC